MNNIIYLNIFIILKIIISNNDTYKLFNKTNIIFIFKLYKNWEIDIKKFKKRKNEYLHKFISIIVFMNVLK